MGAALGGVAPARAAIAAVAAAALAAAGCSSSSAGNAGGSSAPRSTTVMSAASSTGAAPPNPYARPEVAAAEAIPGVRYHVELQHDHVQGVISYDTSPPTGGNHSQYWADCDGAAYGAPIADENAVHALEHGALWITYRPGLPAAQVAALAAKVRGKARMLLSPYPGLRSPVSVQAWNYQLFLDGAADPRLDAFVAALHDNPEVVPEPGATCSQPTFLAHPSTLGHPLWVPAP